VECFLEMLSKVGHYQLSRHVFKDLKVFSKLIELELPVFESFLAACKYQPFTMKHIQVREWPYGDTDSHTFFISNCLVPEKKLTAELGKMLKGLKGAAHSLKTLSKIMNIGKKYFSIDSKIE
jgi:hypothetical protein